MAMGANGREPEHEQGPSPPPEQQPQLNRAHASMCPATEDRALGRARPSRVGGATPRGHGQQQRSAGWSWKLEAGVKMV